MALQTLNTIKQWFKTGLKPSQSQFWDTWDSFRHKYEKIPVKDIDELDTILNTKADKSQLQDHKTDIDAHVGLFNKKEDKANKGIASGYVPLDEFTKITAQYLTIVNDLVTGGTTSLLSAQQGVILQSHIDSINKLLTSDNINLNTIQKIVDAIEQIQISLNTILVNDLTTGGITKALTAEMGKLLQTSKEDKSQKGLAGGYVPLNEFTKIANQYLSITNNLTTGGTTSILSAEQGVVLQKQIDGIKTLLSSDDINLDTIQEIVDAIKAVESNLQNILVNDLATGGVTKALTAEMGKLLNLTKLTATIATDTETQITQAVTEDNKVISRSKLFNWFDWIKKQTQTIAGKWTFTDALIFGSSGYFTSDSTKFYTRAYTGKKLVLGIEGTPNDSVIIDSNGVQILQKVTLPVGTATMPSIVLPYGALNTVPQNGAIERDGSGRLWTTRSGVRYMLTEDDGSYIKILINGGQMLLDTPAPYISTNSVKDTLLGSFAVGGLSNSILTKLSMIAGAGDVVAGGGAIAPTVNKFQVVIKFTNALLASSYWGPGNISELILIDNINATGTTAMLSGTHAGWDANVGLFNGLYVWDSANPGNPKNLNTVSAQIFCRRRIEFADASNANGNNQAIRVYTSITSTLVERIRM